MRRLLLSGIPKFQSQRVKSPEQQNVRLISGAMAEATERASNTDEVLQAVQSHAEHKHDHHYQAKSLPIVFLKAFIYIATWAAAYNGGIARC